MAGKRKLAEDYIVTWIDKLLPGSKNPDLYRALFATMNDKQFDDFMESVNSNKTRLGIIAENLSDIKLETDRNLKLAVELGHEFFERIWIDEGNDIPPYLTPIKYLVVDFPLRRQAQFLTKKISIPENNNSVDDFTGQPTGASKGSKISFPETQIMAAYGLDQSLHELLKFRGGDEKGFAAMNNVISKTGGVSLGAIEALGTTVKSTETLATFLTCMHLKNTLTA